MAFASGSVTFRRYRLINSKFESVDDTLIAALSASAFGRYSCHSEEAVEMGWITPLHLFDTGFAGEKVAVGRFAHFAMRVDKNSVPGSILRSYIQIEQAAALEASGRDFLSKADKRQAKEAATARAEKESRSGAYRRIAAYPVLWDLERGVLFFGNSSASANERMQRLFIDSFDVLMEPMDAHHQAYRMAEKISRKRNLEDAEPAHLIPSPGDVAEETDGVDPDSRGYLGREFLSWLWYRIEGSEGILAMNDGREIGAVVSRLLDLKCDFGLSGSSVVREDAPAVVPEATAAISSGKQPRKMGLLLGGSMGEWSCVLDAQSLSVSGLKLPESEEKDPTLRQEERFEAIAELCGVLDDLYCGFIKERLSTDWPRRLQEMSRWAQQARQRFKVSEPRLASTA